MQGRQRARTREQSTAAFAAQLPSRGFPVAAIESRPWSAPGRCCLPSWRSRPSRRPWAAPPRPQRCAPTPRSRRSQPVRRPTGRVSRLAAAPRGHRGRPVAAIPTPLQRPPGAAACERRHQPPAPRPTTRRRSRSPSTARPRDDPRARRRSGSRAPSPTTTTSPGRRSTSTPFVSERAADLLAPSSTGGRRHRRRPRSSASGSPTEDRSRRIAPWRRASRATFTVSRAARRCSGPREPGRLLVRRARARRRRHGSARDALADGRARTFLPLVRRARPSTPVDTAVVVPLRRQLVYADDGSLDDLAGWTSTLGPGGRLRSLVDFGAAAGSGPVTWVVDPALVDAVRRLAAGNPPRSPGPNLDPDAGRGPDRRGRRHRGPRTPSTSPAPPRARRRPRTGTATGDGGDAARPRRARPRRPGRRPGRRPTGSTGSASAMGPRTRSSPCRTATSTSPRPPPSTTRRGLRQRASPAPPTRLRRLRPADGHPGGRLAERLPRPRPRCGSRCRRARPCWSATRCSSRGQRDRRAPRRRPSSPRRPRPRRSRRRWSPPAAPPTAAPAPTTAPALVAMRQRLLAEAAVRSCVERDRARRLTGCSTPQPPGGDHDRPGTPLVDGARRDSWLPASTPRLLPGRSTCPGCGSPPSRTSPRADAGRPSRLDYPAERQARELAAADFGAARARERAGDTLQNLLTPQQPRRRHGRPTRPWPLVLLRRGTRPAASRAAADGVPRPGSTTGSARSSIERAPGGHPVQLQRPLQRPPSPTASTSRSRSRSTRRRRPRSSSTAPTGRRARRRAAGVTVLLTARTEENGVHEVTLVVTDKRGTAARRHRPAADPLGPGQQRDLALHRHRAGPARSARSRSGWSAACATRRRTPSGAGPEPDRHRQAPSPLPTPRRPPHERDPPPTSARRTARSSPHSAVMAAGTVVSRLSGFVRAALLSAALGAGVHADVFNVANTLPNMLYILLAGGVFNAVLVPQLVRAHAARPGRRRGLHQPGHHRRRRSSWRGDGAAGRWPRRWSWTST